MSIKPSLTISVLLWILAICLCGTVPAQELPSEQPEQKDLSRENTRPASESEIPPAGYVLGAEDVLDIKVYGEPDLWSIAKVSSDGYILMPLIGKLQAAGLTAYQLKQVIEARLRDGYLTNPDVQIFLQMYRERLVHIFGQVGTPGPYRLTHQNTLMETISKAGGFTTIAKRSKVKIIRREDSQSKTIYVDTTRITDKGNLQEDVLLQTGDVIIVPERFF